MIFLTQLKRKEKESFESLMRRFNKILQQEGDLTRAREEMYRSKKIPKYKRRESAIRKKRRKEEKIKKLIY